MLKLNIGCGGIPLPGDWVNLDRISYPHTHILFDLEHAGKEFLKWHDLTTIKDSTFERMLMSHVFEHITNVLPMMEELWRVATPGCELLVLTPYGSSDNADEDPTHVRRVFSTSMAYFDQGMYGTNDYGYRGDWRLAARTFVMRDEYWDKREERMIKAISHQRNVVEEFQCLLVAVKPARARGCEMHKPKDIFRRKSKWPETTER